MPMMNAAQWLFLLTGLTLAYLVLPPFFFILHTSLVIDRGVQAGRFTLQHFENIIESAIFAEQELDHGTPSLICLL